MRKGRARAVRACRLCWGLGARDRRPDVRTDGGRFAVKAAWTPESIGTIRAHIPIGSPIRQQQPLVPTHGTMARMLAVTARP